MMIPIDVLIIGAGPAGLSTALHLVNADAGWASRILIIDKAVFPREKLCGGGVMRFGEQALWRLRLPFAPSHIPIRQAKFVYHHHVFTLRAQPLFRVTHRMEFDFWLLQQAERRGIIVRQGETVFNLKQTEYGVEVMTSQAQFLAKIVVAADGSNSAVRRCLKFPRSPHPPVARLLEVCTPANREQSAFCDGLAVFDFSCMAQGVQGYCWDFPGVHHGEAWVNRGVYDSRVHPARPFSSLPQALEHHLAKQGDVWNTAAVQGFPIRWLDDVSNVSAPRVLFVGDAAGVDPLFGEGISYALSYGDASAEAIISAFNQNDFSCADYRERIMQHPILRQLGGRRKMAKLLYSACGHPQRLHLLWKFAPLLFRCLGWYRPEYLPFPARQIQIEH